MKLNRNTQQKIVSASGAMQLAGAVEAVAHLGVDEVDQHLDEALELVRHAGVAPCARRDRTRPTNSTASSTEKNTLSQWMTEKSTMPFGSLFWRNVR